MTRQPTLTAALLGAETGAKRLALILGGSLLIAIAAQISVPMLPVPMTLQTLAILAVGLTMGARLASAVMLTYLAEGAMGLPVFANGGAGLAYMTGPTAGFLLGFVAMAWLAGWASDRGLTRSFLGAAAVALVASATLYLPGLAWPALVMGTTVPELMSGWMLPFLAGDAVKAVLAALIVTGGWAVLRARRG